MLICLINTPSLPTPGTHFITTSKFVSGFKSLGYEYRLITSDDDLSSIPDTKETIFVLSNHGIVGSGIEKFERYLRFVNSTFILWFYHDILEKNGMKLPLKKWILTGEHFHSKPKLHSHIRFWDIQQKIENYEPLTFSSYLTPKEVATHTRGPILWDAQFVGSPYKVSWLGQIPNCFARTTALSTTEEERVRSFLQSECALGFHSDANVLNNVVVERVPEALSYGAVCLSDNPAAVEYTDGIVDFVSSLEETKNRIQYYKSNKTEADKKRQAGYNWVSSKGTYQHVAARFLSKMKNLGYCK